MSEQKVWVEKMPESCGDCEFCEKSEYYHCNYCSRLDTKLKYINREKDCPLHSIKDFKRELVNENHQKIIKFIEELAWKDVQYDAYQSTMGEFTGSRSAIPRYAKKYFDLWKEMFNEDLEEIQKDIENG